jgi:hypothetical protein
MCDLLIQTHFAVAFMNDPDLRFMSIMTSAGIVGLAAGLVVLEAIRHYRIRNRAKMSRDLHSPVSY